MSKIIFVAVSKAWDQAGVKAVLTEAGLAVDNIHEDSEGEVDIYKQVTEIPADVKLVQVSDGVLLGIVTDGESVKKYDTCSNIWVGKETSFSAALGKCGAVPMVNIAKDVLAGVVAAGMREARTGEEAKTVVTKAAEEFTAYVASVIDMMPIEAFKLDVAFNSFEEDLDPADLDIDEDPEAKPAEGAEPVVQKTETQPTGTEALLANIGAKLEGLPALIDERVAAGIAGITTRLEGVAKGADDARSAADKVSQVLKSVTVGGQTGSDNVTAKKQETNDDAGFAFDTALAPI